jgi:hypothetical protein
MSGGGAGFGGVVRLRSVGARRGQAPAGIGPAALMQVHGGWWGQGWPAILRSQVRRARALRAAPV